MSELDRKFIHDLNGRLAIVCGTARRFIRKQKKDPPQGTIEDAIAAMESILEETDKIEDLIKNKTD